MARGVPFSAALTALIVLMSIVHQTCSIKDSHHCAPSNSCGNIHCIRYPFRLRNDPANCGDPRYNLSCENNKTLVLFIFSAKYHVRRINYNNFTIRVVDSELQKNNFSTIPRYVLTSVDNFSSWDPYTPISSRAKCRHGVHVLLQLFFIPFKEV